MTAPVQYEPLPWLRNRRSAILKDQTGAEGTFAPLKAP